MNVGHKLPWLSRSDIELQCNQKEEPSEINRFEKAFKTSRIL